MSWNQHSFPQPPNLHLPCCEVLNGQHPSLETDPVSDAGAVDERQGHCPPAQAAALVAPADRQQAVCLSGPALRLLLFLKCMKQARLDAVRWQEEERIY